MTTALGSVANVFDKEGWDVYGWTIAIMLTTIACRLRCRICLIAVWH